MQKVDSGQSVYSSDKVQLSDAEPLYMNTRMTTADYINAWGEHQTLTKSCRPQMYKQNSHPHRCTRLELIAPPPYPLGFLVTLQYFEKILKNEVAIMDCVTAGGLWHLPIIQYVAKGYAYGYWIGGELSSTPILNALGLNTNAMYFGIWLVKVCFWKRQGYLFLSFELQNWVLKWKGST